MSVNWIYDYFTPYSRLMVGYDHYGITVREWSDETPEGETGFTVSEGFFTWTQYRNRRRSYCMDDGRGPLKTRLVHAAISLIGYYGGNSDNSGVVPDLHTYLNCHHEFTC